MEELTTDRLEDWRPILPQSNRLFNEIERTLKVKLDEINRFSGKIKENKRKVDGFNSSLYEKFGKMIESMAQQLNIDKEDDRWYVSCYFRHILILK